MPCNCNGGKVTEATTIVCLSCRRLFALIPHYVRGICPHCGTALGALNNYEVR